MASGGDDATVSFLAPALDSLLHHFSSSPGDVDGLLLGYPSAAAAPLTVTGYFFYGRPMAFYDSLGRVDRGALLSALALHHLPRSCTLLGWFSGRRHSAPRPSMRENAVTASLASALGEETLARELWPAAPVRWCVFALLSSPSDPVAGNAPDYQAFVVEVGSSAGAAGRSHREELVGVVDAAPPGFGALYNCVSLPEAHSGRDAASRQVDGVDALVMRRRGEGTGASSGTPNYSLFSFLELREATDGFHPSQKVGEGEYERVYKGFLRHTVVAIKKFHPLIMEEQSEFHREVNILNSVRHPNLVTLMGACPSPEPCLVYEFLPSGSLEDRLLRRGGTPPLSWQARVRIATEVCSALIYLHSHRPDAVVHGGLKPRNVLLDGHLVSKLSDVGLCRLLPGGAPHSAGYLTPASDVCAFGILILQLLTGMPGLDVVEAVEGALAAGNQQLQGVLDGSAGEWPFQQAKRLAKMGLKCCQMGSRSRPTLEKEVWGVLERMMRLSSLAAAPAFQKELDSGSQVRHIDNPCIKEMTQGGEDEATPDKVNEKFSNLEIRHPDHDRIIKDLEDKLKDKEELVGSLLRELEKSREKQNDEQRKADDLKRTVEALESIFRTPEYSQFLYIELQQATNDFENSLKIGEGGYGSVYKGFLRHTAVAIKKLDSQSMQGLPEFYQEVDILTRVRHPNLVSFLGACSYPEPCLVYEFLANGSLEDRLSCTDNSPPLSWQARIRITTEICSALIFLHSHKPHSVVHGDLKPSNILLDGKLVTKLGDFGISRLLTQSNTATNIHRTEPKGTFPYIDPEFGHTGELTVSSDIYSFGVIILQLLTGRPALGVVKAVQDAITSGNLQNIFDKSAGQWPFLQAERLARLGIECCRTNRRNRPRLETEV